MVAQQVDCIRMRTDQQWGVLLASQGRFVLGTCGQRKVGQNGGVLSELKKPYSPLVGVEKHWAVNYFHKGNSSEPRSSSQLYEHSVFLGMSFGRLLTL